MRSKFDPIYFLNTQFWSHCTAKMNMLYLINKNVATDYKQYY